MTWFEDRIRLMGLFVLGALVPFAGLGLLLGAGAWALQGAGPGWTGVGRALLGTGLVLQGIQGLRLAFKSWPGPQGRQLRPGEAPELMNRLEACRASWTGPQARTVVLDANSWGQDLIGTPTLGPLGWSRFHWSIGVYPLLALSLREWEAMLDWEMVWWSGQQVWLNLQAKRMVSYWQTLHGHLGDGQATWARRWLGGFLRPYAKFMVHRLERFLVRECLWTDNLIAGQHGSATFGRAMCRLALLRPLVDRRCFPELEARLQAGESLPEDLYGYLAEILGRCPEGFEGVLQLALDGLEPQAPPLLRVRLKNLGVEPAVPMPPAAAAYRHLLEGTGVFRDLQAVLEARVRLHLQQKVERRQEADRRFQALGPLVRGWFPHHPHALEYLNLAIDRTAPETFLELLQAACATGPHPPELRLLAVRWQLRCGQVPEAQAQVQALLSLNPFLAPACHRLLGRHFRDHDQLAAAEAELNLACRSEALLERARRERHQASLADSLEPHGCGQAQLDAMVSYLKAVGGLGEAFLVRKKLTVHPELPVLLLVVRARGCWWDLKGRKRDAFQARIARECPFPGRATGHVLVLRPGFLWRHRRRFEGLDALILEDLA